MKEPHWVAYDVVLAIHEAQLAEHGGSPGIRDQGLLDSALARPKNLYAYSEQAALAQLAASYAVGLAKNHAFIDGNKRTAWVVCAVFLELNGIPATADQTSVVTIMLGVASGTITEEQFARWLEAQHS
ncbi:MAG: type II toxin-antitoxin system death-on-curing family toxin [Acidobacteriaceae bacterium]|nr:type II toxin-antitoxin system death-on-curing family toxin [Acidobacteriaceae bacterium]MBV9939778.1 type II toxin-antitoxin system death-on-curing family toxin [Acidobacteriaceae bacterium]